MSPRQLQADDPHVCASDAPSGRRRRVAQSRGATRLANLVGASQISIVTTDEAGVVTSWNKAAARLFGRDAHAMIGQSIETIMPARFRPEHAAGMTRMRLGGASKLAGKTVELVGRRANGDEFPIEIAICSWKERGTIAFGALIHDIGERRLREGRLARLALHDPLTGLPNRTGLLQKLGEGLAAGGRATLLLCDIHRLKEVNDTLGNDVGDALLQLVALRLTGHATHQSFAARVSDDEFAILIPVALSTDEMETQARALIDLLGQPFEVGFHRLHIEVNIGVVGSTGSDADQVMGEADVALLQARRMSGSTYRIFDAQMAGLIADRRLLNERLRQATHGQEWELYYQPQVRLDDGVLIGLEALLRWHHPERGLIGPADFMPALERHFGAERVGLWILDEACRQLRAWRDEGCLVPRVAVNLFAAQFEATSLVSDVLDALARHGLQPTDLELEITEKIALGSGGTGEASLRSLAGRGVEISFDDFGTGFASLSSLRRFPVTRLKIDKSFVDDVTDEAASAAVVRAVVSIGQSLGVDVIAEGVETERQRRQLLALGCTSGQGYLFGRPMPAHLVRDHARCS